MPSREQIQDALRNVIDPELRKDIVTLGMVRSIEQPSQGRVDVVVSLTTPGCPIRAHFEKAVIESVSALDGVDTVTVAFEEATASAADGEPVWMGGKSFGGRMASVAVSEGVPAAGLVFLGYPLHPPGKPGRVRDEHLAGIDVPMLFLQGTKDPFAKPSVLEPVLAKLPTATHVAIEGGGHSLERSRGEDPREVARSLAPLVAAFMRGDGA